MREFFKGWRRKVGVIVLSVACGMATAWVASLHSPCSHRIDHAGSAYCFEFQDGVFSAFQYRPEQLEQPITHILAAQEDHRLVTVAFSKWAQILTLLSAYLLLWKPPKRTEPDRA